MPPKLFTKLVQYKNSLTTSSSEVKSRFVLGWFVFLILLCLSLSITTVSKWVLGLDDKPKTVMCMSQQSEAQVLSWVTKRGMDEYVPELAEHHIKGSLLLLLNQSELQGLGIASEFHSRYLATEIASLRASSIGLKCPIPTTVNRDLPALFGASKSWKPEQVAMWLDHEMELDHVIISNFLKMRISGRMLPLLTATDLQDELGVEPHLLRLRILGAIMSLPSEFIEEESHTSSLLQVGRGVMC